MANITAQMVKELRDKTSAGMMDCKAALAETSGDMEAAVDWLRKKGLSKAAKKAGGLALTAYAAAHGLGVHALGKFLVDGCLYVVFKQRGKDGSGGNQDYEEDGKANEYFLHEFHTATRFCGDVKLRIPRP